MLTCLYYPILRKLIFKNSTKTNKKIYKPLFKTNPLLEYYSNDKKNISPELCSGRRGRDFQYQSF